MNLSIIVIVILSVTFTNFCSGAPPIYGMYAYNCRYGELHPEPANPNSCPHGLYEDICGRNVCYKAINETCGNHRQIDRLLRYGECAKYANLMCCNGVCKEWGKECSVPQRNLHGTDFMEFYKSDSHHKLNSNNWLNSKRGQLEYDEY